MPRSCSCCSVSFRSLESGTENMDNSCCERMSIAHNDIAASKQCTRMKCDCDQ